MTITAWLAMEQPDTIVGPDHPCILTDEHGYAVLYTPLIP